ncbi:MAG TPA: hypothetical protein VFE14_01470 [Micromonosporaceae bacterium]|jgi:hypothetical protein|nr:hypothetical protein [Micromonosporaceae bacterium]
MPASDTEEERSGGRLLGVLFWAGVALAPLAALLLLLGQGEQPLRIAAVLAVLAVVLIGLSITLRRDTDAVRAEMEETLLDEIDLLREDVRQDISTAVRASHRQSGEKLQALYESVEALRAQLEAVRAGFDRPVAAPAAAHPAPHVGSARVGTAGVPGHGVPGHGVPGQPPGPGMAPPVVGGGVVRHTETVQVTTRQTIVDPHSDGQAGRGTVYAAGTEYGSGPYAPGRPAESTEESWTEQRLRERLRSRTGDARPGDGRPADPRAADGRPGDGRRPRPYDRDDDPGDDERWSGMRAGDRWASVRTDDRGRELRMGERRSAVHSDESGTEMRIEDRWAAVRREAREESRGRWEREERENRWSDDRWGPEVEDTSRWEDRWSGERRAQPALPAASSEPSWSQSWGAESAGGRRRHAAGRDDEDSYSWEAQLDDPAPSRPARQRRVDYEL